MVDRPTVAVVQDGARLHYAVPIALHRCGRLERVFCNWYSRPRSLDRALANLVSLIRPQLGQRMLDRYAPGLAGATVFSRPLGTSRMQRRRRRFTSEMEYFRWEAEQTARWVIRQGFGKAGALFGFIRNIHPDLLLAAKRQGLMTIGDQIIVPAALEEQEEQLQRERFPSWSESPLQPQGLTADLERRTWDALDHITCASTYVRDGLINQGIAPERITVNAYPLETAAFPFVDRSGRTGPITIGFTGAVNLRKGAPYFLQVARAFDPAKVRFVMVGSCRHLSATAISQLQSRIELVGAVPRSNMPRWLERFDAYLFPSTCEGSAGSIMEAMATGLPVITSPNSGSIVRDEQEGFLAPYDAVDRIVHVTRLLVDNHDLRLQLGRAAADRARIIPVEKYGERLLATIDALLVRGPSCASC